MYYQKQFYRKKHKVENGGAELVAEQTFLADVWFQKDTDKLR